MNTRSKILFFASNPQDMTPLNLDGEIRSITMKIRGSEYLFGLNDRMAIYEELRKLDAPESDAAIAQLIQIATNYELLIHNLNRSEDAISTYLKQKSGNQQN